MRLLVYTDYIYVRDLDGTIWASRAFARFLDALADSLQLVIAGRVQPEPGRSNYALRPSTRFVSLPHYESLTSPVRAVPAMLRSLWRFWRALGDVDAVWLLGPTPLTVAFAMLAGLRRRRIFLGVRQDLPRYVRSRHPDRRAVHLAADALEAVNRRLARRHPVIVVGSDLGRHYSTSPRLLELFVSLIGEDDLVDLDDASGRSYGGELRVLSVGRLETEKNPLLLADILAALRAEDQRYRLVVCGEGPLAPRLQARLEQLGVADAARIEGYVPWHGGLLGIYRSSHVFLHVSWTEGVPQVLFEAFAAGLPVVATDVGGVAAAAAGCAVLVPAGNARAAAEAIAGLVSDSGERRRLVEAGLRRACAHTIEAEQQRLVRFLEAPR